MNTRLWRQGRMIIAAQVLNESQFRKIDGRTIGPGTFGLLPACTHGRRPVLPAVGANTPYVRCGVRFGS